RVAHAGNRAVIAKLALDRRQRVSVRHRRPDVGPIRECESGRHDATHPITPRVVDLQRPADHIGSAAERTLPELVADDDGILKLVLTVESWLRRESAAKNGMHL